MGDRILRDVFLSACLVGICACPDNSTGSEGKAQNAAGTASSGAAGAAATGDACSDDYRHFAVGPTSALATDPKSGIAVRVLDAPVPPEFGYNSWTIQLLDAATMAPAPKAHLTWQCAFMSVHGHGSNPKSIEDLGDGKYKLVDLNMRMFGPWEIMFWIDPTGEMPQYMPTSNIINGMACNPTSGIQGAASVQVKACVPRSSD